jgi:all-trans-retinol dehydrogenase (NAD+)
MGGYALALKVDVSDPESIRQSAELAVKKFGAVSILINNAGIVSGKKILENSNEMIKKTFEVNSIALAYTVKEFLPKMLELNKGHIVTIASAAGVIGSAGLADYSASKYAAIGFDESLRIELSNNKSNVKTT